MNEWIQRTYTVYFAVYKERLNEWTNIQFIHALVCDENDNNNEDDEDDDIVMAGGCDGDGDDDGVCGVGNPL